ncbi:MAG: metallophosphoesterase [Chitinophagales bacterium]
MKSISIAQITDLHIANEGEKPNGIDVRSNFLKILEKVKQASVDYIVVSGDFCLHIGVLEIYEWIKLQLDAVGIPYFVMSGNHDNPAMLASVFEVEDFLQKDELFYSHEIESFGKLIFLDSTNGLVSSQQLSFLISCCKNENKSNLLFIHHPPILADVLHMDKNYSLQNIEEVHSAIEACMSKPQAIFCGHYHCSRAITLPFLNTTVFITPSSSYFQLNPDAVNFEIESKIPAWRNIIWDGKTVKTSIKLESCNE